MSRARSALLLVALTIGCTLNAQTRPAPGASSSAVPVPPASLEPTLRISSEDATPTPTAGAYVPFHVTTWADNVLLRSNPGYLFSRLLALSKGTRLTVLGRSPGSEWLLVQTPDNHVGWVFTELIESEGPDVRSAPVIQPSGVQIVTGHVGDEGGRPVSGIQFALVQGSGSTAPRTDAMTDESGMFYAFVPPETSGTWWLSYTAISCESNIMDSSCNWTGGPSPKGVYVDLPQSADVILEFLWRRP